jgi:hypothetical protein
MILLLKNYEHLKKKALRCKNFHKRLTSWDCGHLTPYFERLTPPPDLTRQGLDAQNQSLRAQNSDGEHLSAIHYAVYVFVKKRKIRHDEALGVLSVEIVT